MPRDELLHDVRCYLGITWEDTEGDQKLSGIIARGIRYLDGIAGSGQDYAAEDKARELLFDYVRYVRSNALDEYQKNYIQELLAFQIMEEVKRYDQEQSANI